jgi:uncharacterized membrane protein YkvI
MEKVKGYFMIIFVIIGALIGAGFASGQEMYLFFYRYGVKGIIGLVLCSVLIGIVIYKTFSIIKEKNIKSYKEFLEHIFNKNQLIVKIMNIIINVFLLATFFIMISGFGAYFEQEFEVSSIVGALLLASVCFLIFMTSIKGVTKANSIVVPLLIACIAIIGFCNLKTISFSNIGGNLVNVDSGFSNNFAWIVQSVIYCSYNMILIIPVLVNLKDYIKNKKQILRISVISAIIVFILAFNIFMLLVNIDADFDLLEMPAVYAITQSFGQFRFIYGMVILLSIFTTAISIGISFLENVVKNKKYFPQIAGIMCIIAVLVSNVGFSNLVKVLFPVFGYLGLVQILKICVKN